ncbi:GlcNAc-transferase family protein [Pantoea osteomyelitidis]|uniref:GlcNAc-transferase family protein n=1 Tax=Pantoea osteomyelitidis TaxID=3230026 RepID=A0ABW7Q2H2_9GAMM
MFRIFASIASYRDPELVPTIKNLVSQAASPEKLHVAVCWQNNESTEIFLQAGMKLINTSMLNDFELLEYKLNGARIDIINVRYHRSQGACWARNMAEKCYDNEAYFLQIDSHCRFIESWDSEMIVLLTSLKEKSAKPVLSHYPTGYDPANEEERLKIDQISRIAFLKFNDDSIPITFPVSYSSDTPVRSMYLAGGFIFAEGSFVKEVPNDPQIFFCGEEIMMSARAFTHGYDIYTPHRILLWHYYNRKNVKVWDDHNKEAKKNGQVEMIWWERNCLSNKRLRHFFDIKKDNNCELGIYAPGSVRSLREFEYASGISFKKHAVQPEVISEERINFFSTPPVNKEKWEERLVSPYQKKIIIDKDKLLFSPEQIEHWHVTVFNSRKHLIDELVFTAEELKQKFDSAVEGKVTLEIKFTTYPCYIPEIIRMIPCFPDSSWGEAVEIKW